jgi:hypothetical protein
MAASLKKITAKKKKPELKPVPQRKSGAAKVLEEKHVGAEITNWALVKPEDMDKAIYQCLRNYGYFYDHKDAFKWGEAWVKKNMTASDLADYKHSEDWRVNTTLGGLCKMHMAGAQLEEKYMKRLHDGIAAAIAAGKVNRQAEALVSAKPVKTSADILAEKIHDFIAEVEAVIDDYHNPKIWVDGENYSVYNELKKIAAPKPLAQKVYDYYKPLYDEIEELVTKKTPDLVEGYKHLKTAKDKKDYLSFIKNIIDDCQKFMNAATAAKVRAPRQPRAKKKVPVEKLIARVKYQKESAEYKLTSVDPANIIGATEVYLFNTKYRHLVQLVAASVDGFSIKGTTITNLREEQCLRKTLRKPEDVLTEIGKTTKARVNKVFIDIATKAAPANGRLNEEMIILKVFK